LNVLRIELPSLRERREDIPLLTQYFVDTFSKEFKRPVAGLSQVAESLLKAHGWPGNVRELRNLVERAVLLSESDVLQPSDFESLKRQPAPSGEVTGQFQLPSAGVNLEEVEKSLVIQALERSGGNQTRAAAMLGLHRDQIRYRIEKFGLRD
jgi:DNA-binding NtrC family response regulator